MKEAAALVAVSVHLQRLEILRCKRFSHLAAAVLLGLVDSRLRQSKEGVCSNWDPSESLKISPTHSIASLENK